MTWLGQVSGRLSGHEIGTDYVTVAADGTRISDYYGVLTAHEERLCLSRDSRPRQGLWPSLHPSHSGNGDPRPSDCAALTLENGHVERLIGSSAETASVPASKRSRFHTLARVGDLRRRITSCWRKRRFSASSRARRVNRDRIASSS